MTSSYTKQDRKGKKIIAGRVSPEIPRMIKVVAAETGTTTKIILENALRDFILSVERRDPETIEKLRQATANRQPRKPRTREPN